MSASDDDRELAILEANHAAQLDALRQENAKLRTQLIAMQQLALAPREPVNLTRRRWVGRSIQLMLVLFGVAIGVAYVKYSDADFIRGARDGYNDARMRAIPR